MKKAYQIPTIIIAEVELQQMIAASELLPLSETPYDGTKTIQSRRRTSVWDDEDEEDEDFEF